jgi:outer membrane receptor protein involved in Fe transport
LIRWCIDTLKDGGSLDGPRIERSGILFFDFEGGAAMRRVLFLGCLVGLLAAIPLQAQSPTGAIAGTVVDASGGGLPAVTITATQAETGAVRTTTSAAKGTFRIPLLPVGTYAVSADLSGFTTAKVSNVIVTVGGEATVKMTLELASVQAAVVVSAETPLIEATKTQVDATVNERMIQNLPTNGRNFEDFVLTTPGVVTDVRGGDISFAGQRGTLNSLVVDGADNNNSFFGQALGRTGSGRAPYQFSQDAVKEFEVLSNSYTAEYGRAGGAVINVVTKSGTNDFHGSGFYFYRDDSLNAKDYIDALNGRPKAPYHFDQFGASLGGPIVRDKVFFFGNYDGQRNSIPNTVVLNVPPGTPTDSATQAGIATLTPLAESWSRAQDQDVYLFKLDAEASSNHHVSLRYNRQDFTGGGFENGGIRNSLQHTGDSLVKTDTLTGSLASSFTPNLYNELRGQYAKDSEPGTANSADPEATILQNGQTVLVIGRNFFSPRETTIKRYQGADTMTWLFGNHAVKGGFDYNHDDILNFFPGNFSGSYTFSSIADFDNGKASRFVQAFPGAGTSGPTTQPNLTDYAAFVQDEWRITQEWTVDVGVRYDLQTVHQPSVQNPDPALVAAGYQTNQIHEDKNNIGPRLGFAWSPGGRGQTVVRGGYGIFYGRTPAIIYGTATSNNGINVQTITFTGPLIPTYPNVFSSIPSGAVLPKPTIFVMNPNYQNPKVQQASLGVEHGLTPDLAVSLNLLHVHADDLTRSIDRNVDGQFVATANIAGDGTVDYLKFNSTRPFPNFSRVIVAESSAKSNYNGLTLEFVKRYSHNWEARLSWAYGHVLDTKPDQTAVVASSADDGKFAQDPLNLNGDYASGDNDVRHRIVLSAVWKLDYAGGISNSFERALASGWTLSGIVYFQTGQPYSAMMPTNVDLNNDGNTRNDRAPGFGRNTFRLPSQLSVNPRITRDIPIGPVDLQLIVEAFNVFNAKNVGYNLAGASVSNTYYSYSAATNTLTRLSTFGTPQASTGPRIVQLAAKVIF